MDLQNEYSVYSNKPEGRKEMTIFGTLLEGLGWVRQNKLKYWFLNSMFIRLIKTM